MRQIRSRTSLRARLPGGTPPGAGLPPCLLARPAASLAMDRTGMKAMPSDTMLEGSAW